MNTPIVAYYRVSTDKQGIHGLGMDAQQESVARYAVATGSTIIAEYTEVESGRRSDRPELARAMKHAKRSKGTLCVAKLDRLSRNLAFLATLMESKVPFVACDMPNANTFTLHILAAVAEHESKMISDRTKAALAAYKARGGTLGGSRPGSATSDPETRLRASQAGCRALRQAALDDYEEEARMIATMRSEGKSLTEIAESLNLQGFTTRNGSSWTKTQVFRVLKRSNWALGADGR